MARNDARSTSNTASGGFGFTITPLAIQQKEFRVRRIGGYKMEDVDVFLDEVTEAVASMQAEIARFRARAGSDPILGSPDLDEVTRQADEIIERAREEAARIASTAHASAADAAFEVAPEQLDAVRAFLTQEKAFLQDLATLVQAHAESVKGMAKASKRPEPPVAEASGDEDADPGGRTPDPRATIRLDEPSEPESEGGPAPADESLRELFWGGGDRGEVTPSEG